MSARDRSMLIVLALALWVGAVRVNEPPLPSPPEFQQPSWPQTLPDFGALAAGAERKQAFVDFLLPMVEHCNRRLGQQREQLLTWQQRLAEGGRLAPGERRQLRRWARRYLPKAAAELSVDRVIARLLSRVDQVPPSLVLAQGAMESGWGTSHFAVAGNNLFGIRCHRVGCGLVPRQRLPGARHEVAVYDGPADSVEHYLFTLNTHEAYRSFRQRRQALRRGGQTLAGLELAAELLDYSERGPDYVRRLRSLIRFNGLDALDEEDLSPRASARPRRD